MKNDFLNWHGKPYYSLDAFCKNTFGEKVYKIALDAGMTCPNRDGTIDTRGCIFCSSGGSGEFASPHANLIHLKREFEGLLSNNTLSRIQLENSSAPLVTAIQQCIQSQIAQGRLLFQGRKTDSVQLRKKHTGHFFIAYFQSYTNTYASLPYLKAIYGAALMEDSVMGISIATRPDCITEEICAMLCELLKSFPQKFIWIELGLQTIHETTARYIRRGYPLSSFSSSLDILHRYDMPVIIHVILGLPGETSSMVMETIHYLNSCHIQGIKLQLLHVLRETDLFIDYEKGGFQVLSLDQYINLVIQCLEHLSPDIVVHRVTGDGPKNLLAAPLWSSNKRHVLNTLHQEMKNRNAFQGKYQKEV